jgi:hypothetical protein
VVKNRESIKELMRWLSNLRQALSAQTDVIKQYAHLLRDPETMRLIDGGERPALIVVATELLGKRAELQNLNQPVVNIESTMH